MGLVLVCLANMVDLLIVMRRFQSIFECYKRIRIDIMISPSKCVGLVADINYCNNICKLDSTTLIVFCISECSLMVGASFGHNFGSRNEQWRRNNVFHAIRSYLYVGGTEEIFSIQKCDYFEGNVLHSAESLAWTTFTLAKVCFAHCSTTRLVGCHYAQNTL